MIGKVNHRAAILLHRRWVPNPSLSTPFGQPRWRHASRGASSVPHRRRHQSLRHTMDAFAGTAEVALQAWRCGRMKHESNSVQELCGNEAGPRRGRQGPVLQGPNLSRAPRQQPRSALQSVGRDGSTAPCLSLPKAPRLHPSQPVWQQPCRRKTQRIVRSLTCVDVVQRGHHVRGPITCECTRAHGQQTNHMPFHWPFATYALRRAVYQGLAE